MPAQWHIISLHWGDNYVAGGSLPGVGGFVSGRTKHIGWGVTVSLSDTVDFYEE